MKLGSLLGILSSVTTLVGLYPAFAEPAYPNRAITMIVPFPAGGSTDVIARLMRDGVSELLGQSIVIENRGGAGGTTGSAVAAAADPDGYTLLLPAGASLTMNRFLQKNYPFDPIRSLAGISFVAESTLFLCVHPSLPATTVAELIAYAKANPGTLSYGTSGVGSAHHVAGEVIKHHAGIDMVHVPYRGGALAMHDLVAGTILVAFATAPIALPQAENGKIRIIASVRPTRDPDLPHIPVVAETIPGVGSVSWFGIFAPEGTPAPVISKLNGAVTTVLKRPETAERFKPQGFKPRSSTPAELDTYLKGETAYWGSMLPSLGLEPE